MKLQPNEMPDALSFALRLTEVSRWGIVAMSRQQSVGEHSYRVCMVALAMYDFLEDGTPHNSFDRIQIASFAMVHDIFEILTGDLDSVFKDAMRAQYPGAVNTIETTMAQGRRDTSKLHDTVAAIERAAKGSVVEYIVKLADMVEALIYLATYGTNTRHAQSVRDDILYRLREKTLEALEGPLARYDGQRLLDFVNQMLDKPGIFPLTTQDLFRDRARRAGTEG